MHQSAGCRRPVRLTDDVCEALALPFLSSASFLRPSLAHQRFTDSRQVLVFLSQASLLPPPPSSLCHSRHECKDAELSVKLTRQDKREVKCLFSPNSSRKMITPADELRQQRHLRSPWKAIHAILSCWFRRRLHVSSFTPSTSIVLLTLAALTLSIACPISGNPSPEARKYGMDYDKDALESMLKEVINDEITKLSGVSGGGGSGFNGKPRSRASAAQEDDRSERLESLRRQQQHLSSSSSSSSSAIGVDDYLDRLTGGSTPERQSDQSRSHASSSLSSPTAADGESASSALRHV